MVVVVVVAEASAVGIFDVVAVVAAVVDAVSVACLSFALRWLLLF